MRVVNMWLILRGVGAGGNSRSRKQRVYPECVRWLNGGSRRRRCSDGVIRCAVARSSTIGGWDKFESVCLSMVASVWRSMEAFEACVVQCAGWKFLPQIGAGSGRRVEQMAEPLSRGASRAEQSSGWKLGWGI